MQMRILGALYRDLLADEHCPLEDQQRALRYGLAHRDYKLLGVLAAHPHLDATIEAQLTKCGAAGVVAALLTRQDRSDAEILAVLAKEKRVTVLETLAGRDDLPTAAYDLLVERAGSRTVSALLRNPALTEAQRVRLLPAAAEHFIGHYQWAAERWLTEHFASRPDLVAKLATLLPDRDSEALIAVATCPELDEATQLRIVASIDTTSGSASIARAIERLADNPALTAAAHAALIAACHAAMQPPANAAPMWQLPWGLRGLPGVLQRLQQRTPVTSPAALGTEAATCTDAARLTALSLLAAGSVPLRVTLLLNPHTPLEVVEALAGHVGSAALEQAATRFAADPERLAHIVMAAPRSMLADLVGRAEQPAVALQGVIALYVGRGQQVPVQVLGAPEVTDEALLALPPSVLSMVFEQPLAIERRRALSRLITAHLGESAERWELFETLAGEFGGTVGQLLEVCDNLAVT
jgi:hypothetical protein